MGEKKLEVALEGMLESTRLQVEDTPPIQCAYVIKGNKVNWCHKAMYQKYYQCSYLVNKKECKK